MLAVRAEQAAEETGRPAHRGFVSEFEPVDVIIHVWAEGADVAHFDALVRGAAKRFAVSHNRAIGQNVGAKFAYQIEGLIQEPGAFRLDLHLFEGAHAKRRNQDVAVGLFRELD